MSTRIRDAYAGPGPVHVRQSGAGPRLFVAWCGACDWDTPLLEENVAHARAVAHRRECAGAKLADPLLDSEAPPDR